MKILAIETSCDETAIALMDASGGLKNPQFKIIKNLVASQIKVHAPFGGVVPNLAKREHLKNLPVLYRKIFGNPKSEILNPKQIQNSKFKILNTIDLIAVTVGPGLEPALWTGITFAKQMYADLRRLQRGLTRKRKVEIIGVSHLEGHLYSNILENVGIKNLFPAIALIISGGHTILIKMDSLAKYKKIGETRDDAVGEAFDKVARLLKLSYPGGPQIEKLAKKGNPNAINFPRPMLSQKNYDFSFSGLKTSVLYYMKDFKSEKNFLVDIAASFQQAAFEVLISKTLRAVKEFNAKSIMVSGGVASNFSLQKNLKLKIKNEKLKINVFFPPKKFCTDNAAMIAAAGYVNYLRKKNRKLTAQGNLSL